MLQQVKMTFLFNIGKNKISQLNKNFNNKNIARDRREFIHFFLSSSIRYLVQRLSKTSGEWGFQKSFLGKPVLCIIALLLVHHCKFYRKSNQKLELNFLNDSYLVK
jgi:hypothetical protein